jgi:hypothetical protein
VFRADFLGFQMRYKVLEMGTRTSGELKVSVDGLLFNFLPRRLQSFLHAVPVLYVPVPLESTWEKA